MLLADRSHLAASLHQQIAGIADLSRCEDKFADFELLNELLFEKPRALLLVECDENPVLFADLLQQGLVVR